MLQRESSGKKFHILWNEYNFHPEPGCVPIIKLNAQGLKLALRYYIRKYRFEMTAVEDYFITSVAAQKFQDHLARCLNRLDSKREEHRLGFIYQKPGCDHSTPFVVIQKKNESKRRVCVLDSLGLTMQSSNAPMVLSMLKDVQIGGQPLEIYYIHDRRQRDNYSCHTDAVLVIKEILSKDPKGDYRLQNVYERLKQLQKSPKRSQRLTGQYAFAYPTQLPNPLIKLVQEPRFLEGSAAVKRLQYVREKGLRLMKVICIQQRLESMKMHLKTYSQDQKYQALEQFLENAKALKNGPYKGKYLEVEAFDQALAEISKKVLAAYPRQMTQTPLGPSFAQLEI